MNTLRILMDARGWSQAEAAKELGLSQSQVSRLLNGKTKKIRARTKRRLENLAAQQAKNSEDELLGRVAAAAIGDNAFRALVEAALILVHKNA